MGSECPECYSVEARITPLLNPRDCLENHLQYICGTCGRCICIDQDEKRGLRRWNFPFKSLEIAKLYLRTADVTAGVPCGIYAIRSQNGRTSYRIFPSPNAFEDYLNRNPEKRSGSSDALYFHEPYREFPLTRIRRLTADEVERYLGEQRVIPSSTKRRFK